jgi:hypothetical protein
MKCLKVIENHEISDYFMKRICENFNFRLCVVENTGTGIMANLEYKLLFFNIFHNNKRVFASNGKINTRISWFVENLEEMQSQLIKFKKHIIYLINRGFDIFETDGSLKIAFPHGLSENEIMMKMELKGLIK